MHMDQYSIALIIFAITYTGIIFTRLPKVNIDRPSAAFFGAVAMIVFGILEFDEAIAAIDFNTIALLLGMMIMITTLELDGFFNLLATKTMAVARNNRRLLFYIIFLTGLASAFMVNDAVVLMFTPVIIMMCQRSELRPMPYLIAEILASNTGSAMTITGNPQNMLIGLNSGINYGAFLLHLLPVSLLGMLAIYFMVRLFYHKDFREVKALGTITDNFEYKLWSMRISVPVFFLVIVLFFIGKPLGLSIPVIALAGASLIMLFGHVRPSRVIKDVDWVLLLFFACLFIVIRAAEKAGILDPLLQQQVFREDFAGMFSIHGWSLIGSQVVSNVPFTVLILPLLKPIQSDFLWLSLASASTLAGNATIIGAIANLIVIESAKKYGIKIRFAEFLKTGLPLTFITLALSLGILYIEWIWLF